MNRPFSLLFYLRCLHAEGLCVEQDKHHDQGVDRERLDQSQTDDHRGHDLARGFGVAGDTFHRAADAEAHADAGAERRDAGLCSARGR